MSNKSELRRIKFFKFKKNLKKWESKQKNISDVEIFTTAIGQNAIAYRINNQKITQ